MREQDWAIQHYCKIRVMLRSCLTTFSGCNQITPPHELIYHFVYNWYIHFDPLK